MKAESGAIAVSGVDIDTGVLSIGATIELSLAPELIARLVV